MKILIALLSAAFFGISASAGDLAEDVAKQLSGGAKPPQVSAPQKIQPAKAGAASKAKASRKTFFIREVVEPIKAGPANSMLTAKDEKLVLDTIDFACADSWCESDFNFHFTSFHCASADKTCKLTYLMDTFDKPQEYSGKGFQATFAKLSGRGTCNFSGITRLEDMVETQTVLSDGFYDTLDKCLSGAIEKASKN